MHAMQTTQTTAARTTQNGRPPTRRISCTRSPTSRRWPSKGSRVITRADNIYLWDSEGNKILDAMCGPVVRQRRLRPAGADRRGDAADEGAAVLQHLLPDRHAAGDRTGRAAGRGDAAAVPACVLLRLGLGRQRHHRAHGAPLLGHPGPARAPGHHQPQQRLPRLDHGRRLARRHERHARTGRPADPRHRAHRAAVLVRAGARRA